MPAEHEKKVKLNGFGWSFNSENESEIQYVKELLECIKGQAEITGSEKYQAHSEEWTRKEMVKMLKLKAYLNAEMETAGNASSWGY